MRCAAPKSPKGLFAGTQSSCGPANIAGPVSRETYDVRPRKVRRACSQGRNRGEASQTPQGLLSGKHTMCSAGKYEWSVLEQIRTPFCSQKSNCSPNATLQPKREYAAERQFVAQTPICCQNTNAQQIASLPPKRQFAY